MSEKKNKKRLKEYQKHYREAKKRVSQMQICQCKYVTKLLLFALLLFFKR